MRVKVYNLNEYVYKEHFKGDDIVIEPGEFVEMESDDAVMFLGTMNRVKADADGNPLPESYKMLKIIQPKDKKAQEAIENEINNKLNTKCQACGYAAVNARDLEIHIKEEHADILLDKDALKKDKTKKAS